MADPVVFTPTSINPTKISSIKLYRAKLLDRLVGKAIPIAPQEPVNVPFDVDDLEAYDDAVLSGVLDAQYPARQAAENIRAAGALNPLNWQRSGDSNYLEHLRTFRRSIKAQYATEIRKLVGAVDDASTFEDEVLMIDLTPFTSVTSLARDLEFGNRCALNVSLAEARSKQIATPLFRVEQQLILNLEAVPRENDVIEVFAQYPDGRPDRMFLGLVSVVEFTEQRGEITNIAVTCYGLSKLLQINKMVVDRAVVDQFEDGAIPQTGLSVIAGGSFYEKTVDQIFTSLMLSQMAATPSMNTLTSARTRLMVEATLATESRSTAEARVRELLRFVSKNTEIQLDQAYEKNRKKAYDQVTAEDRLGERSVDVVKDAVQSVVDPATVKFLVDLPVTESQEDALNILLYRLADVQYARRLEILTSEGGLIEQALKNEGDREAVRIDFTFDQNAFTSESEFQLIYVPLITAMAVRAQSDVWIGQKGVIARFSGRRARAYELMIRNSFRVFFSQISGPNEVLNEVRSKAKFVVYENEIGQIVCEIPRYNEFGADPDEKVEDFIILNPARMTLSHDDVNLMARQDIQGYQPLISPSNEAVGRFTMGQFTDPAVLVRYGMRVTEPAYNPNVASLTDRASPYLLAAVELVVKNARTRTLTVEVTADRQYHPGRLYFVARESLERMIGAPRSFERSEPLQINGYVGYLQNYETRYQHGSPIAHVLTFLWVRKARLLPVFDKVGHAVNYVANFRYLPDIGGFMDVLEKLRREGKLSDGAFGEQAIEPPQGTAEILLDSQTNERYYAALMTLEDNVSLLSLKFLYPPGQQQQARRVTTSSFQLHHQYLAPANGTSDRLAVIKVGNTGEGLQRALVNSVSYIDLRVRALNIAAVASTNLRPNSLSQNIPELQAKRVIFQGIYIPNESINAYYRLAGLRGLKMTLIHLRNENKNISAQTIGPKVVTEESDAGLLWGDFSVASGKPYRLDSTAPNFVILRFTPRRTVPNEYKTTFVASRDDIVRETNYIARVASAATSGQVDTTVVQDVVSGLSAEDPETLQYVVAIFHGPYNASTALLDLVDPGIPLSVYDAAYDIVSTFKFPSTVAIKEDASTLGEDQQKHAQGNAIDLTIFPWMARTGLRLKPHKPYVLQSEYCAQVEKGTHLHSAINASAMVPPPIHVRIQVSPPPPPTKEEMLAGRYFSVYKPERSFRALSELCSKVRVVRKDSTDEVAVAEQAFQKMLEDTGIYPYMQLTDLHENDRRLWHLQV